MPAAEGHLAEDPRHCLLQMGREHMARTGLYVIQHILSVKKRRVGYISHIRIYAKIRAVHLTYFVEAGNLTESTNFVWWCFDKSLNFAVYLAILQLGVRTFVTELTASFQGIADKLLPSSIPGVDCAVCFGFGDSNAVTFGFLAGLVGQILAIIILIVVGSPTIIICGFVPVFFDNATIGLVANEKGGLKACLIIPFISGLVQVFGAALISGWVGLANYGGYLGMFDWDTVWPLMTVVMKYLGYVGVAIVVVALLAIPQIEYRMDPEGYFLITEDYDAYVEHIEKKKAAKA